MARHLNVDLHIVRVGPEMASEFVNAIYHLDEPQADPATINVMLICRLARQHDIKVLLSGTGGDDILTGYRRHLALSHERHWSRLPRSARRGLGRAARLWSTKSPLGRRLNKFCSYADLDGDERISSYFFWTHPDVARRLYGPALREAAPSLVSAKPMLAALRRLPVDTPALNRMLYLDGKFFLTDHNLNYTDKMAMASGVEVRVPLLDPDLIAFAARLPLNFKQHGATGKWIFKRAMESYLPKDVIYRPKTGFGAPIRHWLRHELRGVVDDVLSKTSLQQHGLFEYNEVQRLMRMDERGMIDASYTILAMMWIELWIRIFVDVRQVPPAVHAVPCTA